MARGKITVLIFLFIFFLDSTITFPEATPGVREVEPSMSWQPLTLAGTGVVSDPKNLYS